MNDIDSEHLEIYEWDGEGFSPLVVYGEWLVALMNWELRFDKSEIGNVERHNETDEVFVLICGKSILFVIEETTLKLVDMKPKTLYNVAAGTWHNVVGTRNAKWLIVENNNTSYENTEFRKLNTEELGELDLQFPSWFDN